MNAGLRCLNDLPEAEATAALRRCCGAGRWVDAMVARRPFSDRRELLRTADEIWFDLEPEDWLEAFSQHPRIGAPELDRPGATSADDAWSAEEQSGVSEADDELRRRLARGNEAYFERFGYVFLICATGKGAEEMLEALEDRLDNDPETELRVAAEEQRQITRLRLAKLLQR